MQIFRRKLDKIFTAHYYQLTEALEGYWDTLKKKMFSCNMIGKETNRRPCSQDLLNEFQSGFSIHDKDALYDHCKQFIMILKELGGQAQNVAIKLEKEWGSVDEAFLTGTG